VWLVKKRCIGLVPYFDAGFPGGEDQFISYAATCWATMAITLALPPRTTPSTTPDQVAATASAPAPK
jgi:hypothetical protein